MTYNLDDNSRAETDFRINKYTLKCLRIMLFAITVLWVMNILNIFIVNMKLMSTAFFTVAGTLIFTLVCGRIVDLRKNGLNTYLLR